MGTIVECIWARSDEDKKHEHEALLVAYLVVSIDLFWVFFMSFLYNGVYHRPHPSPSLIFNFKDSDILVYTLTQCSFMYLPKNVFEAQRERVKLWFRPKKCHFYSPLYVFLLTMTAQIESIRRAQYTPLYENEKFERKISQWRLLILTKCWLKYTTPAG